MTSEDWASTIKFAIAGVVFIAAILAFVWACRE